MAPLAVVAEMGAVGAALEAGAAALDMATSWEGSLVLEVALEMEGVADLEVDGVEGI